MPSIIFNTNRNHLDIVAKGKYLPTLKEFIAIGITFSLTVFAWIFFRANSVTHAINYISEIFSGSLFTIPHFEGVKKAYTIVLITGLFLIMEWLGREQQYAIAKLGVSLNRATRWSIYVFLILVIFYKGNYKENVFIYFQF